MQETGLPVWACMGAANHVLVMLPPLPVAQYIIIAADNDQAGIDSANRAAEVFTLQGRVVRIAMPQDAKDFNEMYLTEKALHTR